jgi:hypothetical protein
MNPETQPKRGRGRPVGATSFVNVSLADLQQYVGSSAPVPISRLWLEKMHLTVTPIEASVREASTAPAVQFKVTQLD